ncbi:hypothetical protein RND81_14G154400 [Saponaria officinalis]|uniref:Uncharacterized protein n=1 Tax=Saponaria officinalis TaxID=3572 RepID=A0AAW1GSX7_SAPOF
MDDSNKKVHSKSSTINCSSGNNENESENQRNLQQKNKNFRSPTISAASKFNISPKKKIFNEWKSPKSDQFKLGNSNSSSRKSLPKIPHFSSPKNVVNSHEINDEFDDDDAFDVPYDPLTNYLSPRPKFLRYRPNQKREILVVREEKSDSESNSLRDSVESHGFDDSVESSIENENGEFVISNEQVVFDDENEDVDEFEEENWGLKWVLFKCLIVISALFFCTNFICSMNSSSVIRQESKGIKFWDEFVLNSSLRVVSLRSIDYELWEIEFLEKLKYLDYYNQLQAQLKYDDNVEVDNVGVVENGTLDSMTEVEKVENEGPMVGPGMEDDNGDTVSMTEHEIVDTEATLIVVNESNVEPKMEGVVNLLDSEVDVHDSEEIVSGVELDSGVENATEVSDNVTEEIRAKSKEDQSETVEIEPKFTEDLSETAVVINDSEDFIESEKLRLTFSEMMIWPVILPMFFLSLLSSLVFKFYCKCKRASSKTRSSNVKLCNAPKTRPGLPPKAVEKTAPVVQKADLSEVNPPLVINLQGNLERSTDTIIPKVKKLGEFEVGVEFTQSLKSCSVRAEIEQKDETVYSTPDISKRVMRRSSVSGRATTTSQPSSSGLSITESYSHGSFISQDTTSVMKDVREERSKVTPTPRRSTRLRNKGVTSP